MTHNPIAVDSKPAGFHRWHDLLFVHWRLPVEQVQRLLPANLSVDTWQGSAWVGLVPFRMTGVRPWWSPAVPYLSAFAETNVRTYVRYKDGEPGVWFFSLDAERLAAVLIARWAWRLNYRWARMRVDRQGENICYRSRRLVDRDAVLQVEAEVNGLLVDGLPEVSTARPGSLEEFLIERYVFYNVTAGRCVQGRVHHRPYPLREAKIVSLEETLLTAAGLEVIGPPDHVVYSPGVDVTIGRPRQIGLTCVSDPRGAR